MNPLTRSILTSAIVRLLAVVGATLVTKGWLTPEQASAIDWTEIAGALLIVGAFFWGAFRNYWAQQKLVTAIANPDVSTEHQLEQLIKTGGASSAKTSKNDTPLPVGSVSPTVGGERIA